MNDENNVFNPPGSPDGSTRSPVMAADETTHTADDQDDATLIARDEDIFVSTISTDNEERSVEMGHCQPLVVGNTPNPAVNDLLFDNQPIELNEHHGQPTDEIHYALSPTNWNIAEDHVVPLSPGVQTVTGHIDMTYGNNLLNGQAALFEPVQNQDDDIEMLFAETAATQTVERPVRHDPINNEINNVLIQPIVVIDLTQDENEEMHEVQSNGATSPVVVDLTQDNNGNEEENEMQSNGVTSPVVVDLTQDDDEQEEVRSVQPAPGTNHSNNNEQVNQPVNDPPVVVVPITETLPPSSEAADQNPIIATVIDNSHQTIERTAQLQIPILPSRANKRSSSWDEIRRADKKYDAASVKRWRKSAI